MNGYAVAAPAKVNLYLHVGRPRPDGMHPLESLVAFADIGDRLIARPADDLSLAITGPFAPTLSADAGENLVIAAARRLQAAAGVAFGARLLLEKRLPIASGIGGGSADAAAALRVLNALWRLDFSTADLAAVGAGLGADVPVCVESRAAMMSGVGEKVRATPLPELFAVLVNPLIPAPTAAVYRAFDAKGAGAGFREEGPPDIASEAHTTLRTRRNDLTAAAIEVAPAIADVLRALEDAPGARLVRLSGSGATGFALFEDFRAAESAAAALRANYPSWWIAPTRLGDVDVRPSPL